MPEMVEQEHTYLVPGHLDTQQSYGPFPARLLPLLYAGFFAGVPLGVTAYHNSGLVAAGVAAAMLPVAAVSPFSAWWLDPPFEHGLVSGVRFAARSFKAPEWTNDRPVAIYRMGTQNLETASVGVRDYARLQWGNVLQGIRHPFKVLVRAHSLNALRLLEETQSDERQVAREVAAWLASQIAAAGLIERERYLSFCASDEHELRERQTAIEKLFRL